MNMDATATLYPGPDGFENIRLNGKLITDLAGLDLKVGSHVEKCLLCT